jgi:hypothetical protein
MQSGVACRLMAGTEQTFAHVVGLSYVAVCDEGAFSQAKRLTGWKEWEIGKRDNGQGPGNH